MPAVCWHEDRPTITSEMQEVSGGVVHIAPVGFPNAPVKRKHFLQMIQVACAADWSCNGLWFERNRATIGVSTRGNKAMLDRSPSAVDQVIMAVKDRIRDARYAPGQRLIEPDLMREFGVGRGSVREALRRLAAEGLLEWERYRGASIIRMSRRQVVDFLELRELLEGFAASSAAAKLTSEGSKTLTKLERTPEANSIVPASYNSYNNEFHALILRLSGNLELPAMLDQSRLPIVRLQFNRILLLPDQIKQSRADHTQIARAILKKQPSAAEAAMRVHIRHSAQCILSSTKQYFA